MLWGRRSQCEARDGLFAEVQAGRSRTLAMRGEAGIGKTALLGYAAQTAPDFRVARADGVESEMELPFAALHQLLGPMLGRLDASRPAARTLQMERPDSSRRICASRPGTSLAAAQADFAAW